MGLRLVASARAVALTCTMFAVVPAALAQDAAAPPQPALNSQRFLPAANYHDFVGVESAGTLPARGLAFDFTLTYAHRPLQMTGSEGGRDFGVVEGLSSGHFRVGFGLTEWAEIDLRVPVLQLSQVGLIGDVSGNRVHFSLGDTVVSSKIRFYKNDAGAAIAAIPFVTFPTGRSALHLTHGVPTFGSKVAFSTWAKRFSAGAHIGYRFVPSSAVVGSVAVDDELLYGVGVGVAIAPDQVELNLELLGIAVIGPARWNLPSSALRFGVHSPLEVNANVRISLVSGMDFVFGGGVGLSPGAGTPVGRAVLGLAWAPPKASKDDPDGDGVPTDADLCPRQSEDEDGFEDGDGCPDPDNDQDGVADWLDSCPDEPEDLDGFRDKDGCPEADNDGDGVPDEADRCPAQVARRGARIGPDGCAYDDLDDDGVADADDLCPNSVEDVDGFEDDDGCPDLDNDQDGIADADDVCPDQTEDINGFDDEDGCPDNVKAVVRGQQIVVLRKIPFVTNRADLVEGSFEILAAVRDALVENPDIFLLRVEGYTDSLGNPEHNLQLSESRARSVMNYLVDLGVSPSRLEAVGFGELNPIADNSVESGREANRRVEFSIAVTFDAEEQVPGYEEPAPAEEEPAPAEEEPAAAEEEPAPAEEEPAPAEEEPAPAEEEPAPVGEEPAPAAEELPSTP